MSTQNAAVAAIQFALETDDGLAFLRCWNEGNFDAIRHEWPEAPEAVFIGADPLHEESSVSHAYQSIDEINAILEPETGWRVELGISLHDQSEFLRLYRKTGATWDEKVFVASFPRDSGAGVLAACGAVAGHYFKLGKSRGEMDATTSDCTHQCVKCHHRYVPVDLNEDCPHCGCDGTKGVAAQIEKKPGAIDAEQIAERAKKSQEEQKQREQQQAQQNSLSERIKRMREEDERLVAEDKEAMRKKADLQANVEKGEKSGPKLELEHGGDERKSEIIRERERANERFAADLRGLGTTFSSGFERLSRSVQMSGFVPERALAGAGTEHLAQYGQQAQAAQAQPEQPTAEQPQAAQAQPEQPQKKIEQYDPRFGADAIGGTQAYKDRDEADAERGRGYRELPADQETPERVREDDSYSDRVPKAPEPEPEISDDYDDDFGR